MTDATPSFRTALRERALLRDALALASVPAATLAVYTLPETTRRGLVFVYEEPTVLTAYAAHLVHFRVEHLVTNLVGYALLAGAGYLLAVGADRRRLFGASTATYLLGFPPVLSVLNLAAPRDAVGYGLSGVNMAFAGLLGLVLVSFVGARVTDRVRIDHAPGVFFTVVAAVAVVALPAVRVALGVAAASASLAAVYLARAWREWRATPRFGSADRPTGSVDATVLAAVLFFGYPFVGFAAPPTVGASAVNRYVHLLGFSLGFIVPYVADEVGLVGSESTGATALRTRD